MMKWIVLNTQWLLIVIGGLFLLWGLSKITALRDAAMWLISSKRRQMKRDAKAIKILNRL